MRSRASRAPRSPRVVRRPGRARSTRKRPDGRRFRRVEPRGHECMGQGRQPRRPGLLARSAPGVAGSVLGDRARDGAAGRDPPPSSVAALFTRAPSVDDQRKSPSHAASGPVVPSRSAPVTWTCIANPSAVEPSTAPSASRTSAASTIVAPSPPTSPARTACAARLDDDRRRPRVERVAQVERARAVEVASSRARLDRRASSFVPVGSGPLGLRPAARRRSAGLESPRTGLRPLGAGHPVRRGLAIRRRPPLPVGPGRRVSAWNRASRRG